jgi:dTDP-4-amino-4,6-dideoxygalactose transaminase
MRDAGVQPTFHYVPLHSSEGGRKFSAKPTDCPVTDDISGRLLRLPFYNNLPAPDAERVVATFLEAFGS